MEIADIKVPAKRCLGFISQLKHFHLADLVGQGLARPANIAVDLVDDVGFAFGGVGNEVINGFLPAPTKAVNARVDHEPHSAPHAPVVIDRESISRPAPA